VIRSTTIAVIACVAGLTMAVVVLRVHETRLPVALATERLMYLRSGATASRVFLAWDAMAADVYWIRAIQHYGRDRRAAIQPDRFGLLQPMLELTTTLDPYFNIAYRFGAVLLSTDPPQGPGQVDAALALLEKGLAKNPTRWQYAHDIGFVHYWHTGNFPVAASSFDRAAAMPGAPLWLRPLAALTRARGGDRDGARRLLAELLSTDEPSIQRAASHGLAQLDAVDAIDALQALVEQFSRATGRYPSGWDDLIRARVLRGVPADSTRTPFNYDPISHRVALSQASALAPLPPMLEPR
jgi:hypothetical protein